MAVIKYQWKNRHCGRFFHWCGWRIQQSLRSLYPFACDGKSKLFHHFTAAHELSPMFCFTKPREFNPFQTKENTLSWLGYFLWCTLIEVFRTKYYRSMVNIAKEIQLSQKYLWFLEFVFYKSDYTLTYIAIIYVRVKVFNRYKRVADYTSAWITDKLANSFQFGVYT